MDMLRAEQILAFAGKLKHESVHVPSWGGNVLVWAVSAADRDDYESQTIAEQDKDPERKRRYVRAGWVVLTVRNKDGIPLFNMGQREQISQLAAADLERIIAVAWRLNGVTKSDEDELVKNSVTSQGADLVTT